MAKRKPRLTKKRVDGLLTITGLIDGQIGDFNRDEPEYEALVTANEYLMDLYRWYYAKHDGVLFSAKLRGE